jgi:cobalt-zinc-cadmium efflux system outer membrane protein
MKLDRRDRPSLALFLLSLSAALTLVPRVARAEFPTLERSVQLARARAIVVAEAEGELGVANAQMAGARQSILGNPYSDIQIDKGLEAGQTVQALSYTYFPLDIGGQRGARIDEAQRLIEWRKLGITDARAIATGETVAAYGEMVIGAARIAESESGEATAREEAKYMAGRLEAKDTTVYEKALADAEVARWVQSRAEAQVRFAAARARFGQLTGTVDPERPPASAAVTTPGLRGAWDDAHVARTVDKSPIVQRLLAEGGYWEASAERYRTERFPPVALEVIAGRGALGEARLGGGVVLTFPITRRYQGEIARAEQGRARVTANLALYRNVVAARLRAARDAVQSVNKAIEELDASGLPALEMAVSASVEGYKAGKIELTRVLLARRDLAIARARRLDLLESAWRAYADLTTLSGELP